MQILSFTNQPPFPSQTFTDFEKEDLGEMVLKEIQSDLQRYLDKFHLQQVRDFEEKLAGFEQKCERQIQASIEENVKFQFESHFQRVMQACQKEISQLSSPLFKRAEKDMQSLTNKVTKVNAFCENIKMQYALRWSPPFFALVGTAGLAGALMGLFLFVFSSAVYFCSLYESLSARGLYNGLAGYRDAKRA